MPTLTTPCTKKVAVIGSGAAGLGALWALNRTPHDVYLYEAADRLGGHTNTVDFISGKYKTAVDTGFIVLNSATYPNFIEFLKVLDIPTVATEMSFGVSRDQGLFEWAGTSLGAIFAQKSNVLSLRMWRMIFDIVRFNQFALDILKNEERSRVCINGYREHDGDGAHAPKPQMTIGEYLDGEGYSDAFRDDYLIPMTAAVWSTSPDKCSLGFPAATLIRFLWNHHLLSTIRARPTWLTLKHGSKSYVDAVVKDFASDHLFLNTPVISVSNGSHGKVLVHLQSGKVDTYDHVVLATHGDSALQLISSTATPAEKSILSNFQTSQNTAILHSDTSLMPRRRIAWSSWNYMTLSSPYSSSVMPARRGDINQVCLTYNMNILQHIPTSIFGDVLVTLNPLHYPPPKLVQGYYTYQHPLYTAAAIRSQDALHQIQNKRGISYCGAWTKYGFHEDAFSSGLKVALDHLGATIPFEFKDSTFSRGKAPMLSIVNQLLRMAILIIQAFVVVVEKLYGIDRHVAVGVARIERNDGLVKAKKTD
ncbi:MAG: hypothetical protein M1818_005103 [Claussenomyces sp. TS43310]|nr:MAG: hypothetical protein M1818_005103 [Claussenomyces sp. TS43310]